MRKSTLFAFFVFLFSIFVGQTFAQNSSSGSAGQSIQIQPGQSGITHPGVILPPRPPDNSLNFLGQDDYYSVDFRANGEAVVTLKAIFSNTRDLPLKTINLRVPQINPKDIIVYQVLREQQCIRYNVLPPLPPTLLYPNSGSNLSNCVEYQEPDYFQNYGNAKYQKATVETRGDTLVVILPSEVKPSGSGSFILYFRALGYAKRNAFGGYNYNFQTLEVEDKIRNLQVGINVDSDLVLAGAKGKVNYNVGRGITALAPSAPGQAIRNVQFDTFYQEIGQGSIVKNASNLQVLESYNVGGSYADSYIKLYGKELFISILVVIVISILIIVMVRLIFSKREKSQDRSKIINILETVGLSFGSSFLILSYTFLLFLLGRYLNYINTYELTTLWTILLTIISIGVYALVLIVPALFFGLKKGWGWGVATFGLTIVWLFIYLTIIFTVIFFVYTNPVNIGPLPMGKPLLYQENTKPL